jgi:colanic acid/amylovoran biosynthesis glycosyltransferase
MRIAFMVGQFPALSETFILNQITGLIDRGHEMTILAERASGEAKEHPDVAQYRLHRLTRYERLPDNLLHRAIGLPSRWKLDGAGLRSLNVARYGMDSLSLRLPWASGAWGRGLDFDIVQCHFGALGRKAVLLRAIGALKGKIVTAFHGEDITNYPRRFRGNHYAPLFAAGDSFLPVSGRWNDALLAMGCPSDRIRVHRMGVDAAKFSHTDRAPRAGAKLRLVSVARLVEKKGIGDALQAAARLSVDFDYVVAGDGPLRPELEARARGLGIAEKVKFLGALTHGQVIALLQSADIVLTPSVTGADDDIEGIPVTMMEGMACGLPVVSTWHSAIPDLVADGVSGFLVSEHDIDGLADRLVRLAADPALRSRMGEAGRTIVLREFDIATLNDRLEAHYAELLVSGSAVRIPV